jgi:hypothetical protein
MQVLTSVLIKNILDSGNVIKVKKHKKWMSKLSQSQN